MENKMRIIKIDLKDLARKVVNSCYVRISENEITMEDEYREYICHEIFKVLGDNEVVSVETLDAIIDDLKFFIVHRIVLRITYIYNQFSDEEYEESTNFIREYPIQEESDE